MTADAPAPNGPTRGSGSWRPPGNIPSPAPPARSPVPSPSRATASPGPRPPAGTKKYGRSAEDDDLGQRRRAERGERPEGGGAGRALETLRGLVTRAAVAVEEGRTPPDIENIGALALAIGRIENAGKAGAEQQKAVAREGDRKAAGRSVRPLPGWPRSPEEQKKGLSPDAVAHIRAAVAGQWGNQDPVKCEEAVAEAYRRMKAKDAEDA